MKNWNETKTIMDRLITVFQHRRGAVLVTIVDIEGSSYRKRGAKLLVEADGGLTGNVSGGCLEADVRERAKQVLASGRAEIVTYNTSDDEDSVWGLGMGCNGVITLLLQPMTPGKHRAFVLEASRALSGDARLYWTVVLPPSDAAGGLRLVRDGEVLASTLDALAAEKLFLGGPIEPSGIHREGDFRVFSETLSPPPFLVVCGAGDDAGPLCRLAQEVGFRVVVVDHRSAYAVSSRFSDGVKVVQQRPEECGADLPSDKNTYVVIMTHSTSQDALWLKKFANSKAAYIGLLGPGERRRKLVQQLELAMDQRIVGPVGLDLGADGSEQIAVSIVAQLLIHRQSEAGPAQPVPETGGGQSS